MKKQRYVIKNNPQGSPEWLQDRLAHFTGTDAQAVANNGAGLISLVYEKVAEKLTKKSKDSYQNEAMLRGSEIEPLGRSAYEIDRGVSIKEVGFIELNEFIGASVDGLIDEDGIFELKCPSSANFVKFLYEGKIAPAYQWQIQHYLYVLDRQWCDFCIFHPDFEQSLIITRVERDPEKVAKLEEGLSKGIQMAKDILAKI